MYVLWFEHPEKGFRRHMLSGGGAAHSGRQHVMMARARNAARCVLRQQASKRVGIV